MKHYGATCPGLQINRPKNGIDDRGGGKEMGWSQKKKTCKWRKGWTVASRMCLGGQLALEGSMGL